MRTISTDYLPKLTLKEALSIFFERSNLPPDGGMSDRWVKLKVWKFYIPFPNTASRKDAVRFHDIHHILTGYPSDWKGEAEVGAWEISTSCGHYPIAWILDMGIFALGLYLFPKAVFKAFIRGRRTINFYQRKYTYEQLLEMKIDEAKAILKLYPKNDVAASFKEVFEFIGWWLISSIISFLIFVAPVAFIIHLIVDR